MGGVCVLFACACGGRLEKAIPPPPPDAGAVSEASTLDAPSTDAMKLTSWCATYAPLANLCDDFDLPTEPRVEWSPFGSGLGVVDTTSSSAPHSLRAKSSAPAYLSYAATSAPYGMKIEAALELVADGASSAGDPPVLLAIDSENGQNLELALLPGTTSARCTFPGHATDFVLPRDGSWHGVGMKISFNDDGSVNFICDVDGTDHGLPSLPVGQDLGKVTLTVGARGSTTAPVEVYYDDVVITY
jgi:hypothetical protein